MAAAPLRDLDDAVRAAGLTTPALAIIGPVVGQRPEKSWFELRPLLGQRVLVTRPPRQAGELIDRLETLGAIPIAMPVIDIAPPEDWSPVDEAIAALPSVDWLIFTSANGVESFMRRLREKGQDARALGSARVAVIGSATAQALDAFFLKPDLVARGAMNSEALVEELAPLVSGSRVLIAQAAEGRSLSRERLATIANVSAIDVYRQIELPATDPDTLDQLRRGEVDWVTLTSPNIAKAFLARCDETIRGRLIHGETRVVTNSPRVSAIAREAGIHQVEESANPAIDSMIDTMIARHR